MASPKPSVIIPVCSKSAMVVPLSRHLPTRSAETETTVWIAAAAWTRASLTPAHRQPPRT